MAEPAPKEPKPSKLVHYKGKLVVVGEMAVGKTSIITRLVRGTYLKNQPSSIGVSFSQSQIKVSPSACVRLELWDTAGQERFRSINNLYYRNSAAGVAVYDVTNRETFETVKSYWLNQLRSCGVKNILLALAGNKCDLESEREVSTEEARKFAAEEGLIFMETSASSGTNISELFSAIAKDVPSVVQSGEGNSGFTVTSIEAEKGTDSKAPSGGCKC